MRSYYQCAQGLVGSVKPGPGSQIGARHRSPASGAVVARTVRMAARILLVIYDYIIIITEYVLLRTGYGMMDFMAPSSMIQASHRQPYILSSIIS